MRTTAAALHIVSGYPPPCKSNAQSNSRCCFRNFWSRRIRSPTGPCTPPEEEADWGVRVLQLRALPLRGDVPVLLRAPRGVPVLGRGGACAPPMQRMQLSRALLVLG